MKLFKNYIMFSIILLLISTSYAQEKLNVPGGPYLGQKLPGMTPELFAGSMLSSREFSALGIAFTENGREVYFSSWNKGEGGAAVMVSKEVNGTWTEPVIAPFSGKYRDWDLGLAPDGKRLYYSSWRPVEAGGEPVKVSNIWYVERQGSDEWGEPVYMTEINTENHEVHPSVAANGNLYFFTQIGPNPPDIYMTEFVNGRYSKPAALGNAINTEHGEADPYIAPDESYLIFHSGRPGGYGKNDLYVSFKNSDGTWSEAVNMGKGINSEHRDYCGRMTIDGKQLFFTRRTDEDGYNKFYWIDSQAVFELKRD